MSLVVQFFGTHCIQVQSIVYGVDVTGIIKGAPIDCQVLRAPEYLNPALTLGLGPHSSYYCYFYYYYHHQ